MWTKIKNEGPAFRPAVTKPRVCRGKKGPAYLRVPSDISRGSKRADFFSDGNGRIAVRFSPEGEYAVHASSKRSAQVVIPSRYAASIPVGTTETSEVYEDGMLVIDLSEIPAPVAENA